MKFFRTDRVLEAEVVKEKIVRCEACGARNRIYIIRGKSNLCGSCRAFLNPFPALGRFRKLTAAARHIFAFSVCVALVVVGLNFVNRTENPDKAMPSVSFGENHARAQFVRVPSSPPVIERIPANPRSLPNGTILNDFDGDGMGTLIVDNDTSKDAVAKLVGFGAEKATVAVYVGAGQSVGVEHITDGSYELYFAVGIDWDGTNFGFEKQFSKFDNVANFKTTRSTYSTFSFGLHPTPNGNTKTSKVAPQDFEQF